MLDLNEWQKRRIADLAANHALTKGGVVAVLGLAFKKDTNDFRESPAIDVCNRLLAAGLRLRLQDERADATAFAACLDGGPQPRLHFCASPEEAAQGADAVLVLTEWDRYAKLDWSALSAIVAQGAAIFDGRAVIDRATARAAGFKVFAVGKG